MPGDARPFLAEELLEHASFLGNLAGELVGRSAGEDVVQDALVRALERPPREQRSLRGWLAVVVSNLARNARRAEQRRGSREARAARPERLEPDQLVLERLEIQRVLVEQVLALPVEQRTVLHLRFFEGQAPRAIAARLGVPLKTVQSRQARALAALRAALDARSNGDRGTWMAALVPLASPPAAGAGSASALLGGLAMKKAVGTVVVVVLAFLAWRGAAHGWLGERYARSRSPTYVPEAPLVTAPAALAAALAPEVLAQRQPLGQSGPPTTGALVVDLRHSDGAPAVDWPLALECRNDPAPRVETFRARTDAQGQARIEDLFAGPVRLLAGPSSVEAEVAAGETRALELTLDPDFDVRGTVEDASGAPVAGAEIWGGRTSRHWPGGFLLTRSDAAGRFSLRDIEAFTPIGARKVGHVASAMLVPMDMPGSGDGTRLAQLVLEARGGTVVGRVLDPDGRPLAGAGVLAGPDGGWTIPDRPGCTPEPAFAETDADGAFALGCELPAGRQPLHATARGFPVWRGEIEVATGQATRIEIRLERPGRVEGRVLGVEGQPAAGVDVLASEEDRGGWYHERFAPPESVSGAGGWFVLDGLAPGTRELNAHDHDRPELGRARASVVCVAGTTTTCELRLELGLTIAGRVVDEDGAPLAGWSVHSQSPLTRQWYPRRARTDAQGRFVLANLGDSPHDLTVRAPSIEDFPRAKLEGVPVGARDVLLVVEDARRVPGRVRGRLVAPQGASAWDYTLTLWREEAREGHFLEVDGATGVFETEAQPGRYFVKVSAGGVEKLASDLVTLEEDGVADFGDLQLEGGGRVEIEVTGPPAALLERLSFHLDRAGASTVDLEWQDGLLVSPEVMPGRWRVTLNEDELYLAEDEVEVASGTTTRVTLALAPSIPVALRWIEPPPGGVTFEVFDREGRLLWKRRYLELRQELTLRLRPGPQRITARADGGARAELELDVTPALAGAEPIPLELR